MSWIANLAIVVFIVLTLVFALRGFRRGLLGSLEGLIALVLTGVLFYLYVRDLLALLRQYTPLDGLMAYLLLWVALYLVVLIALKILFSLLQRFLPESFGESKLSRGGGLLVGGTFGAISGLALVYILSIYDEYRYEHGPIDNIALYNVSRSAVAGVTTAVAKTLDPAPATVNFTQSLALSPVATTRRMERVAENQDLHGLLNQPESQELLHQGLVDRLMGQPRFQQLMTDPDVRHLLADMGLAADTPEGQREVAEKLTQAWQRRDAIQRDPRVRAIMDDPEFQRQLHSDSKLQLMMNPQLARLTEIVFAEATASVPDGLETEQRYRVRDSNGAVLRELEGGDNDREETIIHRRMDDQGVIHYSDQ